jgi:cobaltochelatase CobT
MPSRDGESATTESAAEAEDGEPVEGEVSSEQSEDLSDATEPEDGAKPQRRESAFAHQDEWGYKVYTAEFDEEIAAPDLCEPEELARLARLPGPAAFRLARAWYRGWPTSCSAC